MTIKRFFSKIKGRYLHRFKPLKYAERVGVNFLDFVTVLWLRENAINK